MGGCYSKKAAKAALKKHRMDRPVKGQRTTTNNTSKKTSSPTTDDDNSSPTPPGSHTPTSITQGSKQQTKTRAMKITVKDEGSKRSSPAGNILRTRSGSKSSSGTATTTAASPAALASTHHPRPPYKASTVAPAPTNKPSAKPLNRFGFRQSPAALGIKSGESTDSVNSILSDVQTDSNSNIFDIDGTEERLVIPERRCDNSSSSESLKAKRKGSPSVRSSKTPTDNSLVQRRSDNSSSNESLKAKRSSSTPVRSSKSPGGSKTTGNLNLTVGGKITAYTKQLPKPQLATVKSFSPKPASPNPGSNTPQNTKLRSAVSVDQSAKSKQPARTIFQVRSSRDSESSTRSVEVDSGLGSSSESDRLKGGETGSSSGTVNLEEDMSDVWLKSKQSLVESVKRRSRTMEVNGDGSFSIKKQDGEGVVDAGVGSGSPAEKKTRLSKEKQRDSTITYGMARQKFAPYARNRFGYYQTGVKSTPDVDSLGKKTYGSQTQTPTVTKIPGSAGLVRNRVAMMEKTPRKAVQASLRKNSLKKPSIRPTSLDKTPMLLPVTERTVELSRPVCRRLEYSEGLQKAEERECVETSVGKIAEDILIVGSIETETQGVNGYVEMENHGTYYETKYTRSLPKDALKFSPTSNKTSGFCKVAQDAKETEKGVVSPVDIENGSGSSVGVKSGLIETSDESSVKVLSPQSESSFEILESLSETADLEDLGDETEIYETLKIREKKLLDSEVKSFAVSSSSDGSNVAEAYQNAKINAVSTSPAGSNVAEASQNAKINAGSTVSPGSNVAEAYQNAKINAVSTSPAWSNVANASLNEAQTMYAKPSVLPKPKIEILVKKSPTSLPISEIESLSLNRLPRDGSTAAPVTDRAQTNVAVQSSKGKDAVEACTESQGYIDRQTSGEPVSLWKATEVQRSIEHSRRSPESSVESQAKVPEAVRSNEASRKVVDTQISVNSKKLTFQNVPEGLRSELSQLCKESSKLAAHKASEASKSNEAARRTLEAQISVEEQNFVYQKVPEGLRSTEHSQTSQKAMEVLRWTEQGQHSTERHRMASQKVPEGLRSTEHSQVLNEPPQRQTSLVTQRSTESQKSSMTPPQAMTESGEHSTNTLSGMCTPTMASGREMDQDFLIDDEIADQPGLMFGGESNMASSFFTDDGIFDDLTSTSPSHSGLKVGGERHRADSVDTTSSLGADDLMLDYETDDKMAGSNISPVAAPRHTGTRPKLSRLTINIPGRRYEEEVLSPDASEIFSEWNAIMAGMSTSLSERCVTRDGSNSSSTSSTGVSRLPTRLRHGSLSEVAGPDPRRPPVLRPPRQGGAAEVEGGGLYLDRTSHHYMCQEVQALKTMLLRLRRILQDAQTINPFDTNLKSSLYLSLASSDAGAAPAASSPTLPHPFTELTQDNADLRRQVVLLQQQLEEKDRTIRLLQHQLSHTLTSSQQEQENSVAEVRSDSVNAATQTERTVRSSLAGSGLSRTASIDDGLGPTVSSEDVAANS